MLIIFAPSISVTLISRLMLNLHEAANIGLYMGSIVVHQSEHEPPQETHISFYRPSDDEDKRITC